jgi:hypothetical protein
MPRGFSVFVRVQCPRRRYHLDQRSAENSSIPTRRRTRAAVEARNELEPEGNSDLPRVILVVVFDASTKV